MNCELVLVLATGALGALFLAIGLRHIFAGSGAMVREGLAIAITFVRVRSRAVRRRIWGWN